MKSISSGNKLTVTLLIFGFVLVCGTAALAQHQHWKPKGVGVPVFALAFSPDGKTLAAAGGNGVVNLWDAANGRLKQTLQSNSGPVRAITFILDSRQLVTGGSWDRHIKVWNTLKGVVEYSFKSDDKILTLALHPSGNLLASGCLNRTLIVWDITSGEQRFVRLDHKRAVRSLAFSPDGQILASASDDRLLMLWNPITGDQQQVLAGHEGPVMAVTFSPDGNQLASASLDHTIKLWSPKNGALMNTLSGHKGPVQAVTFNPQQAILASASRDGNIKLWNSNNGTLLNTLSGHKYLDINISTKIAPSTLG